MTAKTLDDFSTCAKGLKRYTRIFGFQSECLIRFTFLIAALLPGADYRTKTRNTTI